MTSKNTEQEHALKLVGRFHFEQLFDCQFNVLPTKDHKTVKNARGDEQMSERL